ncbi:MAG TPA: sugar ABC transporter ATP-binding protein [Pyrinomonadaceae bacterium]|nr:sugar ABC transporter ATP-binding protein [Pyrinomonadaceae bacterium]
MSKEILLKAENVTKSYAGVHALRDASFELRAGEIHALIGENGAGKSTFIKIITGAVSFDSGEIEIGGAKITENSPSFAKSLGVAAIYQQPALFPELTVAENIAIGQEKSGLFGRVNWKKRRQIAEDLLARVGARIDPETYAGELSMPQQQLVEIARALGASAKILILDEPTASLSEEDTNNLFRVIRELQESGVGMIYISHRLEELPEIADRVTVLRDGETIETRQMSEVSRQELIRLMVGREISAVFPKQKVEIGECIFELRNLTSRSAGIKNINLSVKAGEIVGVAGLVGAGRTELAKTIFGLETVDAGEILVRGKSIKIGHPSEAVEFGIAYLPEDRRKHGVILEFPISSNITLASLKILSGFKGMNFRREKEVAAEYTERLGVKTQSIHSSVATLSGGNQQKVALSRWLMTKPSVLILDEPTQGIDVGAKSEIHALMSELAANGVAILMISSELPEILGMSDRIAVMAGGTIVKILDREEATQDAILSIALGHFENGKGNGKAAVN